jgi:hypothetical protein
MLDKPGIDSPPGGLVVPPAALLPTRPVDEEKIFLRALRVLHGDIRSSFLNHEDREAHEDVFLDAVDDEKYLRIPCPIFYFIPALNPTCPHPQH